MKQKKSDNKLFFFADNIDIPFVRNEIENLSERFDKVNVITFTSSPTIQFKKNVSITSLNYNNYSTKQIFSKYFCQIAKLTMGELLKYPNYFLHIKLFRVQVSRLCRCFYLYDCLKANDNILDKRNICYTFWFNDWATVLSILKSNADINEFYSRVHGADLFEERVPKTKRIAFRWFQLNEVAKVFSVSQKGANYLKEKYPDFAQKIYTGYLGTEDHFQGSGPTPNKFTIVTCAKIRNIKRIHLIPEILQHINFPLRWIHIGGEDKNDPTTKTLHKNLEKLKVSNKNIEIDFYGNISNTEIFEVYNKNFVNLFISVSETEGLPVSMMEAISFGIPILATNVGGCSEIVTPQTGFLVPVNFKKEEVADIIINEYNRSKFNKDARSIIRQFWSKKFSAQKNIDFLLAQFS